MTAVAFSRSKTELTNPDRWIAWPQVQDQRGLLHQLGVAGNDDVGLQVGLLQSPRLGQLTKLRSAADLEFPVPLQLQQFCLAPSGG